MSRIKNNYYLVEYKNKDENMGNETGEGGIISFFKKEHFKCTAGYWGCPWYYVDIVSKTFKPGRPGVSYGKVIGNKLISFDHFKAIYRGINNRNSVSWKEIEEASIFKTAKPAPIKRNNYRNVEKITVVLSNGMLARIPAKNWKKTLERLERNIQMVKVVYGTYRLSDGTLVSIPREGAKETLEKMEIRINTRNNYDKL